MKYLNENNLDEIGINWAETVGVIEETVKCLDKGDFSQPIKPYLRYKNLKNRIIAMPAFVGGKFNISGIKWIASFPDNLSKGIPRAHSVVILNNADTGEPVSIINTALLSIIRTVSVSGLMMRYYSNARKMDKFNLGIIGWGPIGRHHLRLFTDLYGDKIEKIFLYDIRPIINVDEIDFPNKEKIVITDNWEDAYKDSDVFITCTVSSERYINLKPKNGSLQLNVSLRDYTADIFDYVKDAIVVDDWDEVCRENTDIEFMHKERGLSKESAKTIGDVVCRNYIENLQEEQCVMFNPMGMGVFDIAIGNYYFEKSKGREIGTNLN
jgi:ornithine cyclodeaminase